jgi:hypothetical protein
MASTIQWFGGAGSPEIAPAASGGLNTLGFFGASFGFSIRVGEYNTTTFRTNSNGTSNGSQLPNIKYANASGAFVGASLVAEELLEIENALSTLNIRLTTDNAIKTQNSRFRAFDRVNINSNPSGVWIGAAETRKDQALVRGSGNQFWQQIFGSGSVLALEDQTTANSTVHDWFIQLTASPLSIGEKTEIGYYFETEFL